MTCRQLIRRTATGVVLAFAVAPAWAASVTGPDPALAPGQDRRPVGATISSTVYRDPDGTPYVLRGPDEKQYLSGYNVTWIDKDHVLTPPGVGGFD